MVLAVARSQCLESAYCQAFSCLEWCGCCTSWCCSWCRLSYGVATGLLESGRRALATLPVTCPATSDGTVSARGLLGGLLLHEVLASMSLCLLSCVSVFLLSCVLCLLSCVCVCCPVSVCMSVFCVYRCLQLVMSQRFPPIPADGGVCGR